MIKEILVTGGAGYIGSSVVNMLVKKYRIIIVDNLSTGNKSLIHPDVIFYKIDILNAKKLVEI